MNLDPPNNDPAPAEERRRPQGAAPQAGDGASDLSNTPPSIPKIPSCDLQTGGEDWLDFSLYVNHSRFKQLSERFDQAQRLAKQHVALEPIEFGGHAWTLSAGAASAGTGKKRVFYRWRLQSNNGLVLLLMNREKRHRTMPNALASAHSTLLMSEGAGSVWRQLQSAFRDLGARLVESKLSRVDPCIDCPYVKVDAFTQPYMDQHFVTRARIDAAYDHEEQFVDRSGGTYRFGSRLTGYTMGSGDVRLRVYDKAHEVRFKPEKQRLLYQRRCGDLFIDATRVEFQLRREWLKKQGVQTLEDWFAKRGAVLEYLTQKWFRLTDGPYDRKHPDRTPTLPIWQVVQEKAQQWAGQSAGEVLAPIVGEPPRLDQLVLQAVGVMVTAMARENIKVNSNAFFLDELIERIDEAIETRDMAEEVYRRAIELGVYKP
ncbi:Replication initiation factor [Botrimarina colliarenosi]|uniref:Replication initiation factor n=1 Tax=Botrimarina colliarenosi TaxID=2528001 RepID=A0A5C6ADT8_9BACT|nr:hypothetical protein [Botrimarina colliarenosi]TWT97567.1 Replication initiation factor [Botrimarina colliarenosi]